MFFGLFGPPLLVPPPIATSLLLLDFCLSTWSWIKTETVKWCVKLESLALNFSFVSKTHKEDYGISFLRCSRDIILKLVKLYILLQTWIAKLVKKDLAEEKNHSHQDNAPFQKVQWVEVRNACACTVFCQIRGIQ